MEKPKNLTITTLKNHRHLVNRSYTTIENVDENIDLSSTDHDRSIIFRNILAQFSVVIIKLSLNSRLNEIKWSPESVGGSRPAQLGLIWLDSNAYIHKNNSETV